MNAFAIPDFERQFDVRREQAPAFPDYRQKSLDDLRQQGLPGAKTEDWKYTSVREVLGETFVEATPAAPVAVPECAARHLAVMVNGYLNTDLSRLEDLPEGVTLCSLAAARDNHRDQVDAMLGRVVRHDRHPFAALNGAFFRDGLFLDVAPGTQVQEPLVVLWLSGAGDAALIQPRVLVRVGEGAELALMEQHRGSAAGHFTNQVSEILVGDNAGLTQVQLQDTGKEQLVCGTHVRCSRDSRYRAQTIDLGGKLIRNDLAISLDQPGAEADADGVFLAGRDQHVDNHLRVDHRAPNCDSSALYKGLLGGGGRGVFNGKLIVHPEGQKTRAEQTNHNLLLARDVEIDTKPELEIYADDVKCSHGSTSGELDPDQLFYLRSRGIDSPEARALLVRSFALEISERMNHSRLRDLVGEQLEPALDRLARNELEG